MTNIANLKILLGISLNDSNKTSDTKAIETIIDSTIKEGILIFT